MEEKEYQDKIKELEKQLEEEKKNNNLDDIRKKYEEVIEEKNNEINELSKANDILNEKMNNTVNNLNDEVKLKLEQSEKLVELNKQVEELLQDKAEATVDKYITEGKILPAQRETALKLCLKDNDTFLELYKDAKPIVEVKTRKSTMASDKLERIGNYFKN